MGTTLGKRASVEEVGGLEANLKGCSPTQFLPSPPLPSSSLTPIPLSHAPLRDEPAVSGSPHRVSVCCDTFSTLIAQTTSQKKSFLFYVLSVEHPAVAIRKVTNKPMLSSNPRPGFTSAE